MPEPTYVYMYIGLIVSQIVFRFSPDILCEVVFPQVSSSITNF